jgi:N-acetylglucosamine transport system permease protein
MRLRNGKACKANTSSYILLRDHVKERSQLFLAYAILFLWAGVTILLMAWVVLNSFKTNPQLFMDPWGIPKPINIQSYVHAWSIAKMGSYFTNSMIVVSMSVFVTIFIGAMAAYVLARFEFKGSNLLLYAFIGGMGIPIQLLLVPLFMVLRQFHLLDSHLGLILVYVGISLPFTVFVLTGFFRSLPTEIEEAAAIDGCTEFQIYWKVMLPLASPGLITAAVFNFVTLWNEYLLALVLLTDPDLSTLSLGMYNLKTAMTYSVDWTALFAGVVIMMIPSLIVYLLLQRFIIQGLTLGAVKG